MVYLCTKGSLHCIQLNLVKTIITEKFKQYIQLNSPFKAKSLKYYKFQQPAGDNFIILYKEFSLIFTSYLVFTLIQLKKYKSNFKFYYKTSTLLLNLIKFMKCTVMMYRVKKNF